MEKKDLEVKKLKKARLKARLSKKLCSFAIKKNIKWIDFAQIYLISTYMNSRSALYNNKSFEA
jgi:hypothetical protein